MKKTFAVYLGSIVLMFLMILGYAFYGKYYWSIVLPLIVFAVEAVVISFLGIQYYTLYKFHLVGKMLMNQNILIGREKSRSMKQERSLEEL